MSYSGPNMAASPSTPAMSTLHAHSKDLTKAIAAERTACVAIAGVLIGKGLIKNEVMTDMMKAETDEEKTVVFVDAVKDVVGREPKKFKEFLDVLSGQQWTKKVADEMKSTYQKSVEANAKSSDKVLTDQDLTKLLELIHNYSYKWDMIATSLGFLPAEVNSIRGMPMLFMSAPTSYLKEILNRWVQWPTDDHPTRPTLRVLCTSLRSSMVGLGALADKVEREMKPKAVTDAGGSVDLEEHKHPHSTGMAVQTRMDSTRLSSKPELHELDLIEGSGKKVEIIRKAAGVWERIATRLHFEGDEIKRIARDNHHKTEDACRDVFSQWRQGKGRQPKTWQTVIKAVEEAELSELAKDLKCALGGQ